MSMVDETEDKKDAIRLYGIVSFSFIDIFASRIGSICTKVAAAAAAVAATAMV